MTMHYVEVKHNCYENCDGKTKPDLDHWPRISQCHTCVPFSTSISPVARSRSYNSSQADAVPVISEDVSVLIKLFLLAMLFRLEALLSLECSPNQTSRSWSVFMPLRLEGADLSPSFSLLNEKNWSLSVLSKNRQVLLLVVSLRGKHLKRTGRG